MVTDNLSLFIFFSPFGNVMESCDEHWLGRFALAAFMSAVAIDVRSFFHGFTSGTAVLAGGCFAGTDRMRAFFCRIGCHVFLLMQAESIRVQLYDRGFEQA
jgi:hypothetical protein